MKIIIRCEKCGRECRGDIPTADTLEVDVPPCPTCLQEAREKGQTEKATETEIAGGVT